MFTMVLASDQVYPPNTSPGTPPALPHPTDVHLPTAERCPIAQVPSKRAICVAPSDYPPIAVPPRRASPCRPPRTVCTRSILTKYKGTSRLIEETLAVGCKGRRKAFINRTRPMKLLRQKIAFASFIYKLKTWHEFCFYR